MSKPTSIIWGNKLKATHLGCGIFLVSTERHGGIAIAKESLTADEKALDFLKPLNNLDLTAFEVSDDPDFLYFEEHQHINVIHSLMPVQMLQNVLGVLTYDHAAAIQIQAQSALKNYQPMIYEQFYGEKLNAQNCKAIAEAEFYWENQGKVLIKANYAPDSTDMVEVTTQYLSDGEIYGSGLAKIHTYLMSLEDFENRVKDKAVKKYYPTNQQPQHLIGKDVIESISDFKKAS